jgi:hypothetical protein
MQKPPLTPPMKMATWQVFLTGFVVGISLYSVILLMNLALTSTIIKKEAS